MFTVFIFRFTIDIEVDKN